jgi:hypothetical protein
MSMKKSFFITAALFIIASADAMATTYNVDNFVLRTINPTDTWNLRSSSSYGIVSASDYGFVLSLVISGFNGGEWNGAGITSSLAAADSSVNCFTTLAITSGFDAINFLGAETFHEHVIQDTDSLIRYTYNGDCNLDGVVDDLDYGYINYAYDVAGTPDAVSGFVWGDFDYDGVITDSDYGYINYLYDSGGAPYGPLGDYFTYRQSTSAVPEPATIALLLTAALGGLLWWRRRT